MWPTACFRRRCCFFPISLPLCEKKTAKPLHVHLMVSDAILLSQIEQFAEAGADLISLHAENANATQGLALIAELGLHAGLVLQVHTPVQVAAAFLEKISFLTLLGTQIGVKGQALNPEANGRLAQARLLIGKSLNARGGHRLVLAADGGIREHTVPGLRQSGAQTIVMGSLAFGARNLKETMSWVHAHGSGM